ncbi:MAG: YlxR family protein [Synechocystis sp.]|nr:YlxR family protein [Synechocystis sp.]
MPPGYRRCLSCRKVAHRREFWRIVRVHPSRTVQLDHGSGRSAYVCPTASCLAKARHKNLLGRSLRSPVPEALFTQLESRLPPPL